MRGERLFAAGAISWILVAGLQVYAAGVLAHVEQAIAPEQDRLVDRLRDDLASGRLPPDKVPAASRLHARLRYERDGIAVEYIAADGQPKQYEPTQEDCELHAALVQGRRSAAHGTASVHRALWVWILLGLGAVAAGFLLPSQPAGKAEAKAQHEQD